MAKTITISLKDSEYEDITLRSKKDGITVRDYINKKVKNVDAFDHIFAKINKIEKKLSDIDEKLNSLKSGSDSTYEALSSLKNSLSNSLKIISKNIAISSNYSLIRLKYIVQDELKLEEVKARIFETAEDYSEKVFNIFFDREKR